MAQHTLCATALHESRRTAEMGMERLYETACQQISAGGVQFVEDVGAWPKHFGAVNSPSMKLLVAQSAIFECLWCAKKTTRAMFSHAGAQSVFASEHVRCVTRALQARCTAASERERMAIPTTRSQPWMRGLPHSADHFEIELLEAPSRDCLQPQCNQIPLTNAKWLKGALDLSFLLVRRLLFLLLLFLLLLLVVNGFCVLSPKLRVFRPSPPCNIFALGSSTHDMKRVATEKLAVQRHARAEGHVLAWRSGCSLAEARHRHLGSQKGHQRGGQEALLFPPLPVSPWAVLLGGLGLSGTNSKVSFNLNVFLHFSVFICFGLF